MCNKLKVPHFDFVMDDLDSCLNAGKARLTRLLLFLENLLCFNLSAHHYEFTLDEESNYLLVALLVAQN